MSEQKKKVRYSYAGKETLESIIYKSFPPQLRPTEKTNTYLGAIFFIVIVLALIQFPYGSLMTGNTDITINVGYPWPFLQFDLIDIEGNPLRIGGLVLDLILYIFIAYLLDITTNLILKNPLLLSKKDTKKIPKIFDDKRAKTLAEKLTKKVAEKTSPPIPEKTEIPKIFDNKKVGTVAEKLTKKVAEKTSPSVSKKIKTLKIFDDKRAKTLAEKLTKKVAEKTSPPIPEKIDNPQTSPVDNSKPSSSSQI